MKRPMTLLAALGAAGALAAASATAAAAPTVVTGGATAVTTSGVTLHGTVDPNGNQTSYDFEYGPTTALGSATGYASAGSGTRTTAVTAHLRRLSPGTTYYYRLTALSGAGAAHGRVRSFTTTGHPPALAVTGPAVAVTQTSAQPTGSINAEGAATTWQIQYGLTSGYGVETFAQTLPAATAPAPVSARLVGLAPGKLFHYRLVAYHANHVVSAGADATFFTYPRFRRAAGMRTRTRPGRALHAPFRFTTAGSLHGARFVPAALRCTGVVSVAYFDGARRVALALTQVAQPSCTFSTPITFRHRLGAGAAALRVVIHYRGNGYLKRATATDHVTLG